MVTDTDHSGTLMSNLASGQEKYKTGRIRRRLLRLRGRGTRTGAPDITFATLEREFPTIRDRLIAAKFAGWKSDLEFLLSYMQMIRARSPLFFAQADAEGRAMRGWTVKSVGPEPNKVVLESMEAAPMPETWVRNRIIVRMREEIEKVRRG